MANSKSAEKRYRQADQRRSRNRMYRTRLRTQIKALRRATQNGDSALVGSLLPQTIREIDRLAGKGVLHLNAAARTKSRLVRAAQNLS